MTIYLDHNATTPLREEVAEAMARALREVFGNPSSTHHVGAAARRELDRARERVAALVGAAPAEVVFTSGATEANHAAIHGVLRAAGPAARAVTTTTEHPSVAEPLRALEAEGVAVTRVGVDSEGRVDLAEVAEALGPGTALVSVILANNETGVIQDVAAIAELTRARGVPLHVDATQAVGKIALNVAALGADLLTASAHKFYGPKGAGFLVQREGVALEPWLRGGAQERGRRGGTENVVGVLGLGLACELARHELPARTARLAALRDRLWEGLREHVPRLRRNGSAVHVLPNTLNVELEDADGEVLLEALDLEGVCVSAGAACHSGAIEPSRVLLAMGRTPAQARASLRLSVGHGVDEAQVDRVVALLAELVPRAREIAA
jgi:cysteine desulfurase